MTTTVDNNDPENRGRVRESASAAKARASDAYTAARERTSSAYGTARESATRARQRTSEGVDSNPVAALIGGLALCGLLAAILPKTEREEELLGDYGRKINDRAREATSSAISAAQSKLDELGYNRDTARQKVQSLKSDVAEIAGAAAQEAKSSATQS